MWNLNMIIKECLRCNKVCIIGHDDPAYPFTNTFCGRSSEWCGLFYTNGHNLITGPNLEKTFRTNFRNYVKQPK
jgi:hypothetical protein